MSLQTLDYALKVCFELIWRTSLQATVFVAFVMLVQVLFKRMFTPRWSYIFGLVALLRLIAPVFPTSPLSIFNLEKVISPLHPNLPELVPAVFSTAMITAPSTVISPAISVSFFVKYIWFVGFAGLLVMVGRQHRKIARCVRNQPSVEDAGVLALLANCQNLLGIKQRIRIVATDMLKTPALFGNLRPCLLIPAEMLQAQRHRELRLILLHELIHFKNRDVVLNWFIIAVRSLHWFNPCLSVWLTF